MAATKYTYSVADDTANAAVSLSSLDREIRASAIATTLRYSEVAGDVLDITFDDALSGGDQTLLGTIVGAHDGTSPSYSQPVHQHSPTLGANAPTTSDGKPIVTANAFPGWCVETVAGAGDDSTNGVGAGQIFQLSEDQADTDEVVEFYFNDSAYLAAGGAMFKGALLGDHVSLQVFAPATATTPNAGSGNCNLVATGLGFNLIAPAAGDGSHDITLADACLVPSPDSTGYYDWDAPYSGKGTITVSATPGAALYNLFDVALPIAQFATKVPVLGDGHITLGISNVKAKKLLPHWKGKCTLHNEAGTSTLELAFYLKLGRASTV